MATMPITPTTLPTPPSRDDPANFATRGDAFLGALPTYQTELNSISTTNYNNTVESNTSATTATTKAAEAVASASSASTSATTATTKAAEAVASALQASKLNLGAKSTAPTVDNQGEVLLQGATYYDTSLSKWRAWNGTTWVDPVSVTAGVSSINGQAGVVSIWSGLKNAVINSGFSVNQRGYTSGAATTVGQYTLDRWKVTGTGGITFATINNKTTVTIPSGQTLQQVIEGINLQSGTYVLSWEGTAQGRINSGSYGSTGTVSATITGGTNTTVEFNAGTVSNVQLEIGSVASPFELRPYGLEILLCQRYLPVIIGPTVIGSGWCSSATQCYVEVPHQVQPRISPTGIVISAVSGFNVYASNATSLPCTSVTLNAGGNQMSRLSVQVASGLNAGQATGMFAPGSSQTIFFTGCEL